MGLLGEALFLFLGEFKNASQMGPDRFVASPDNQDGACVSRRPVAWAWARGILEKPFADRGKRGMIALEGRRSSFRGRMVSYGDMTEQKEPAVEEAGIFFDGLTFR